MKDVGFFKSSLEAIATMLVYLNAALAGNASQIAKILLTGLPAGFRRSEGSQ